MQDKNQYTPELRFPEFHDEWQMKHLGEIAVFYKGKGISKSEASLQGKTPCVRYGELYTYYNEIITETKSFTNIQTDNLFLSKKNDIIIPSSGETKEDISTASCVMKNGIALGGDINIIRTNNDGIFFAYYLNNAKKYDIAKIAQGISIIHLYNEQLKNLSVCFPTLSEQRKIASCLSSLDDLIKSVGDKIELLKQHKKGLMQKLFPKKECNVPELRFKGFEGEWEEIKFGSILKENKNVSKVDNEDILLSSTINGIFLNSEVFSHQRGMNTIGYRKIKLNMLILSAQNLHLGNANVNLKYEHGLISPAYKTYEIINTDPIFFSHWIKRDSSKFFFFLATTEGASACRRNVVWDKLYNQLICIPTLAEQQKIASCLSSIDTAIEETEKKLQMLQQHKKGLMQKMFVKM